MLEIDVAAVAVGLVGAKGIETVGTPDADALIVVDPGTVAPS
jgi:hypothetical protein